MAIGKTEFGRPGALKRLLDELSDEKDKFRGALSQARKDKSRAMRKEQMKKAFNERRMSMGRSQRDDMKADHMAGRFDKSKWEEFQNKQINKKRVSDYEKRFESDRDLVKEYEDRFKGDLPTVNNDYKAGK